MSQLEESLLRAYDISKIRSRIFSSDGRDDEQLNQELKEQADWARHYNQEGPDYDRNLSFNYMVAAYLTLGMMNDSYRWANKNGKKGTKLLRQLISNNVRMLGQVNRELGSVKDPWEEADGDR